jgi:hypothetical protein
MMMCYTGFIQEAFSGKQIHVKNHQPAVYDIRLADERQKKLLFE